ncbi:head-tail connector protein [Candidatus Sororendozoicomonas aggregata]|uniref:head-tail connector protein n=1 Tax=Candidatus Sororendozoicomonas aggregata TaxID=3073239 RepID=UPI002ED3B3E7
MRFLTLEMIKRQCRIELDDSEEDESLTFYGKAAEAVVVNHLNRPLYVEAVPENESSGLVMSDDIRMAMLLLVSDFYENRGHAPGSAPHKLPFVARQLLAPYRIIAI